MCAGWPLGWVGWCNCWLLVGVGVGIGCWFSLVGFLIRNISHKFKNSQKAYCKLNIFNNSKKITKTRIVKGNTYDVIKLNNLNQKLKSNYFSWNLSSTNGDLEVLWVAFSKDGAICGDHSY